MATHQGNLIVGWAPVDLGRIVAYLPEFMYYLYLPISLKGSRDIVLPKNLGTIEPLVLKALQDVVDYKNSYKDMYIYVTAKKMVVAPDNIGNRAGWHVDGFGSEGDLNYIWYDANPTEFACQEFTGIPNEDEESMVEIEKQVDTKHIITYDNQTLLRLDETVVHRVNPNPETCVRTFIKITASEHIFANEGNSHNYDLDYSWNKEYRDPTKRNLDHGQD